MWRFEQRTFYIGSLRVKVILATCEDPRVHNFHIICMVHQIKLGLKEAFVKIISDYTKIKGPKCWVRTKLNKMRCKKSWVACLLVY